MEELIKQVTTRAGISEEQARTAVTTVLGFLKDKLPAAVGGQLENVIAGGGGVAETLGDMAGKVGGMFGK